MGHVRKVVLIDAPPEGVWDVLRDADRLPEWNEELVAVKDVSGPLDHPGAGYTQVMSFAGRRVEGRFEVTAAEYLKGREIEATPPLMRYARGRDRLEPREGGTEVTVELDYELKGGAFGRLLDAVFLRRMMERTFERNGHNLKRLIERPPRLKTRG